MPGSTDVPRPGPRTQIQRIGLFVGPALAVALFVAPRFGYWLDPAQPALNAIAAVTLWMATWWITEAIPIPATALLPLVLFPLLSIPPGRAIAERYGHPLIFLFLGGFLVAIAIEQSGLHRRVALGVVSLVGDNPRRVVAGFMIATAVLSMWLSNSATTMMLLPIALSVLAQSDGQPEEDPVRRRRFSVALLLGVAYGASIGGAATLIGTPPNISFKAIFEQIYPQADPISFAGWMALALPFSASMLAAAWCLLAVVLYPVGTAPFLGGQSAIRRQLDELGPLRPAERRMAIIFVTTAILWIFREPVPGWGWAPWLSLDRLPGGTVLADDGTVAMLMSLVCFLTPSGQPHGEPLLRWEAASRVPWGILLLFGGGMALAHGMQSTGLDAYVGRWLAGRLDGLPAAGMVAATSGGMTCLTELTSNLASVTMLLPVLASTADQLGVNPRLLMIPATLSASCAFMLPVATPPNAIVFGSGRLRIGDMVRAGVVLNLVGIFFVVAWSLLVGLV